jgi:hypothetical protein
MRLLLSTANLGAIDDARLPHVAQIVPPGLTVDFVRFDDATFPPRRTALHPRLQAKLPKMLAHELRPGYDWYMWIDGSIYLAHAHAVIWMLSKLGDEQIALFRHPFRASIRDEAAYCLKEMQQGDAYLADRYRDEPIQEQVRTYLSDPDFVDHRLFACGVFCYPATLVERHPRFLSDWYYHCARHTVQDQLSLPYVLHQHSVGVSRIDDNIFETPYFGMKRHLR